MREQAFCFIRTVVLGDPVRGLEVLIQRNFKVPQVTNVIPDDLQPKPHTSDQTEF